MPIMLVRKMSFPDAFFLLLPFNSIFLIALGGFVILTSFFSTKEVEELEYRGWKVGYFRKLHILRKTKEEKLRARKEGILMIAIGVVIYFIFYLMVQDNILSL